MPRISEYKIESKFIDRLESIGHHYGRHFQVRKS